MGIMDKLKRVVAHRKESKQNILRMKKKKADIEKRIESKSQPVYFRTRQKMTYEEQMKKAGMTPKEINKLKGKK